MFSGIENRSADQSGIVDRRDRWSLLPAQKCAKNSQIHSNKFKKEHLHKSRCSFFYRSLPLLGQGHFQDKTNQKLTN